MGMHPRWLKVDTAYSQTQRTVDRQFLFKPDPVVKNIIGACAAKAQQAHPVKIYWLEVNINHEHNGIAALSDSPKDLNNLVRFKQTFHRLVANELNGYLGREGSVFASPPRSTECVDDPSLEEQFFYALTNPVKDGLVDRVCQWGGFSSYNALARGVVETFVSYDRTAWNKQKHKKNARPLHAFARRLQIEYSPLPAWEGMTDGQRQTHIRRETRKLEQQFRQQREQQGLTVMGPARLAKLDPRDRPSTPAKRTPKPLCHASSPERALEYAAAFKEFLKAYKTASALYLAGMFDVEFPPGSFRPPIIVACFPGFLGG